jgi:hypothetical protein
MTREDVIRMARETGLLGTAAMERLERFANLVAAAEREECARILDSVNNYANPMTADDCADAIRARGQG